MALILAMAMAAITTSDLQAAYEYMTRRSANSLADYLSFVVIDRQPEPARWDEVIEPWQVDLVEPLIAPMEQLTGLRREYDGPRNFWYTLPKGHDKTGLIGRLANWSVAFSCRPLSAATAAGSRDQASLLLDSMKREQQLNPWLARRLEPFRNTVHGPGGRLTVLSSEAGTQSGRKDDLVICDELTFWPSRDLFDILFAGRWKRADAVFVIITNAGLIGSWQHKLYEMAKASDDWLVYETPPGVHYASWMNEERIEKERVALRRGIAKRVLDNIWIDATETPLLSRELILSCKDSDCLWPFGDPPRGKRPELYIGVDFGRTKNRTVIWTSEMVGDVLHSRDVTVLHNVSFAEQESVIRSKLKSGRVVKCKLDKGAQGWTTTENLEAAFPGVCEGEHLTGGFRGLIAANLKTAFQKRTVRIPADNDEMVEDLMRVEEVETANGRPRLKADESEDGFHADYFWAMALMLSGVPNTPRQKMSIPFGIKARR